MLGKSKLTRVGEDRRKYKPVQEERKYKPVQEERKYNPVQEERKVTSQPGAFESGITTRYNYLKQIAKKTWSWPSGWCIGLRSWLRGFDAKLGHLHVACTSLP